MKVKVIYIAETREDVDIELDAKIRKGLEDVGFEWYAQGRNFETGERDIGFDYNEKR